MQAGNRRITIVASAFLFFRHLLSISDRSG
jgi:hypothetical protein